MTAAVALNRGHEPIHYEVVHYVAGRVRLKIAKIRESSQFTEDLVAYLKAQPNVISVRVNTRTASLIVGFDHSSISLGKLLTLFDIEPERLPAAPRHLKLDSVCAASAQDTSLLLRAVQLADEHLTPAVQALVGAAAFAAALIEAPVMITAPLLVAAAAPIAGRAVKSACVDKHVGVDALDGTAAAMMLARGNFVSAGFMTALIGLGEVIREQTSQKCQKMMGDLLGLAGRSAWVVRGKRRAFVPADTVAVGDIVVVYPGEMIPVDGLVIRGNGEVDQSGLTGESLPIDVAEGSTVYASTILLQGKVYVRCMAVGANTKAGLTLELVNSAPLHETLMQNYAARAADRMVMPVLLGSAACYAVTGNVTRTLSMLIFDFATGIRIAAPTAVLASMERAARRGILIKSGAALERLARVNAIVFDKTGTLTTGEPQVTDVIVLNGISRERMVALAAGAEQRLHHPASRAIIKYARKERLEIPHRAESEHARGAGVTAVIDGLRVCVGSGRLLERLGIDISQGRDLQRNIAERGESLAYVAVEQTLAGVISYKDQLRPEAAGVLKKLKKLGVKQIVMATGDVEAAAASVATAAGISDVVSSAFPEHKAELVQQLKAKGYTVAVVGDGINDSPALAHADVAIALHGGTDAARNQADVVLTDDDLTRLPEAMAIARGAMALIQQTIGLVVVPNGAGIVFAAMGMVGPAMATLLNNGCAILSAINSLRPLYIDPFANNGRYVVELDS